MITSCKNTIFHSPKMSVFVLLTTLLVLCYRFSCLLVTLGLDHKTSIFTGQVMFGVIILGIGAGVRRCGAVDGGEDNVEAAMNETTNGIEDDPPGYDDVLDQDEKSCPSYN